MRPRIFTLVLLLVILPTAVLSLLAGRALRDWDLLIHRRQEQSALDMARATVSRIERQMDDALAATRAGVLAELTQAGVTPDYERVLGHLRRGHPLVGRLFLFMHPWGFIYPEDARGEGSVTGARLADELTAVLRRAIPDAGGAPARVRTAGGCFLFQALGEGRGLYAGLQVDTAALQAWLVKAQEDARAMGLALEIGGPGLPSESAPVMVEDSLDGNGGPLLSASVRGVVVRQILAPPLDEYSVRVAVEQTPEARRAIGLQERLYAGGAILMAVGILAGMTLILLESAREIRHVRTRSEFLIGVSHDLRTPLASIRVLAESLHLNRVPDPERRRKFIESILTEVERLSQLTERVLFFVRFGQRAMYYRLTPVAASELAAGVAQSLAARWGHGRLSEATPAELHCGGHRLRLNLSPGAPGDGPHVRGDERALQQVLLNLLDNAFKYSPPAPDAVRPPEVSLSVRRVRCRRPWRWPARAWVRFEVSDEGIGMTRAEARRLFRPFWRGDRARRANVSGVGLGLAVSRHVVHAHGGWMAVSSAPGRGSTFRVWLPEAGEEGGA